MNILLCLLLAYLLGFAQTQDGSVCCINCVSVCVELATNGDADPCKADSDKCRAPCSNDCSNGKYISSCDFNFDTPPVCSQCCPTGQYSTGGCSGSTPASGCATCSTCTSGSTYAQTACTYNSNTVCSACTGCAAGSYRTNVCTITANTQCAGCPANTNSALGSDGREDCTCNIGYFGSFTAVAGSCTACPDGKYGKGSDGSRTSESSGCDSCAQGKYGNGAAKTSEPTGCLGCPANSYSALAALDIVNCYCNIGYFGANGGSCSMCPDGKYGKGSDGSRISESAGCDSCAQGKYGNGAAKTSEPTGCLGCPANSYSALASLDITNCYCNLGYFGANGGACSPCSSGKYGKGSDGSRTTELLACESCAPGKYGLGAARTSETTGCSGCPVNSVSALGSDELADCTCNAGYWGTSGSCTACVTGKYGLGAAKTSEISGCSSCPDFSWSSQASTSLSSCACNAGYYGSIGGPCTACPNNMYSVGTNQVTQSAGCALCTNALPLNSYWSANGGSSSTGCQHSLCSNKPANSIYLPDALNINSNCMWNCNAGYQRDTISSACQACPQSTYSPLANSSCLSCVAGLHFPYTNAYTKSSTGNLQCDWDCNGGFFRPGDNSIQCLPTVTTDLDPLTLQAFSVALDETSTHVKVRLSNLSSSHQTTETVASYAKASTPLKHPCVDPTGNHVYFISGLSYSKIVRLPLKKPYTSTLATIAGSDTQGSSIGALSSASFTQLSHINVNRDSTLILALDQDGDQIKSLDFSSQTVATLKTKAAADKFTHLKLSGSGVFALTVVANTIQTLTLASNTLAFLAGGSPTYQDGTGSAAQFKPITGLAISGDDSTAFVTHAHPTDSARGVLRKVVIASGAVSTLASETWLLSVSSLSASISPLRVWASSAASKEFYQILTTAASASLEAKYGDAAAAVEGTDDTTLGPIHLETFSSITALSVWRCRRPGHDCATDWSHAPACARGLFSTGDTACQSCPRGTSSNLLAAPACPPCAQDTYAAMEASTSCSTCVPDCTPSQYRQSCGGVTGGTCSPCQPCSTGRFRLNCTGLFAGTCEVCSNLPATTQYASEYPLCLSHICAATPLALGYYWSLTSWPSSPCLQIPCTNKPLHSNYTAFNNVDANCAYRCLDGYQLSSSACSPCSPGYFSSHPSFPSCTSCPSGSVSVAASTTCTSCGAGFFANASDLSYCYPCSSGTYSVPSSFQCSACPAGQFTSSSTGPCQSCDPGYFTSLQGSSQCSPCPPFAFAATSGLSACSTCVQGIHNPPNSAFVSAQASPACPFACNSGYTRTVTALGVRCEYIDPSLASARFSLVVSSPQVSTQDTEKYAVIVQNALSVTRGQVFASVSSVTATDTTFQITVTASSASVAQALSTLASSSAFQLTVNQQCIAQGLSAAVVSSVVAPQTVPAPTTSLSTQRATTITTQARTTTTSATQARTTTTSATQAIPLQTTSSPAQGPQTSAPQASTQTQTSSIACTGQGSVLVQTPSGQRCQYLSRSTPYFYFAITVSSASLTPQQIENYAVVYAEALGVSRDRVLVSFQVPPLSGNRRLLSSADTVLYLTVTASTQQQAVLLAAQLTTSTFQQNINTALQLYTLSPATVDPQSIAYINAPQQQPQTTTTASLSGPAPPPPPPPPPPISIPINPGPRSDATRIGEDQSSGPDAVLLTMLCLFALAYALPHAEDWD